MSRVLTVANSGRMVGLVCSKVHSLHCFHCIPSVRRVTEASPLRSVFGVLCRAAFKGHCANPLGFLWSIFVLKHKSSLHPSSVQHLQILICRKVNEHQRALLEEFAVEEAIKEQSSFAEKW
jgi:hypothetical protein